MRKIAFAFLFVFASTVIVSILFSASGSPARAKEKIPAAAQNSADENFPKIKQFQYGNTNDNTSFGPLHPIYTITRNFVTKKTTAEKGIITANEYISIVYYKGNPVDGVSIYKNEKGRFDIGMIGYRDSTAAELGKLKGNENLLYNAQYEEWYLLEGNTLKPLTEAAVDFAKNQDLTLSRYQDLVHERYISSPKEETYTGRGVFYYVITALFIGGGCFLLINQNRLSKN